MKKGVSAVEDSADRAGRWWDGVCCRWIGVNAAAYVVVVVGGVALELLASNTTFMPGALRRSRLGGLIHEYVQA